MNIMAAPFFLCVCACHVLTLVGTLRSMTQTTDKVCLKLIMIRFVKTLVNNYHINKSLYQTISVLP